ncbi:MAG: 50S ribosomal protein L24 [Pseudomonadales bacterium]|nr:50S ribosomal protein L24 [Pseudomonadales bacterium]
MRKIKTDDRVMVIAGKDKGKIGTVTRTLDNGRAFVSGVNMIKRHTKGNPQAGQPGGIIEKEASIHISNVAIYNSESNKADRVGIKVLEDGKKVRIFRSTGEQIDG